MVQPEEIKPHMPVVGANSGQIAEVDHMEGQDTIKLRKDTQGEHHYVPLSWVDTIEDGKVKLNRSDEQAMQEWSTAAPQH